MPIHSAQGSEGTASRPSEDAVRTLSLDRLWYTLVRQWPVVLSVTVLSAAIALLYIYKAPRLYSAAATFDISQQNSQTSLSDIISTPMSREENTRIQTEERVMQSTSVLLEVADVLQLGDNPIFRGMTQGKSVARLDEHQRGDLVSKLREGLSLSVLPGTTIVSVSYTSTDPKLARDLPNTLIDVYIGQDLGSGQIGTKRVSDWLQQQTEDLRKQVEDSARKLADFQRAHNIIGADESENVLTDKLQVLNTQLAAAQVERIGTETNYRVAQSGNPELVGTLGLDPQLQALHAQQVQLQGEYNALSTRYDVGYPRIGELQKQLRAIGDQITAEIAHLQEHYRADYQISKQREDQLTGAVKAQEKVIYNLDEQAADYAILRHNAEATRTLYDQITIKLKESGIIDTLKSTRFRIVDPAMMPVIPVAPRKHIIITTGLFVGILGGILLALLVDTFNDAVFSGEELERRTGLPIIGAMPHINMDEKGAPKSQLVSLKNVSGGPAEAFRGLRSAIQLGFGSTGAKLLVITSTTQGEGKSLIAANYARVLAQSGARVLLIDADTRRGTLHRRFDIPVSPGLTTFVSSPHIPIEFINPDADIPTLSVLPRGPVPPNPTDLLASTRFMQLIDQWREEFDYVVVDSAPILPVADTLAIAQRAEIVLLVVRVGVTSRSQFLRVCERLGRMNVPTKGFILNDIKKTSLDYGYYYGSYSYNEDNGGRNL